MQNLEIVFSKSSCVPENPQNCCINGTARMCGCHSVHGAPAEALSLSLKLSSSQNFYSDMIEETSKVLNCVTDFCSRKTWKGYHREIVSGWLFNTIMNESRLYSEPRTRNVWDFKMKIAFAVNYRDHVIILKINQY